MIWQKEFYRVISYCKDRPNRSERVTQTPAMREQNQKKVNMATFRFLLFGLWSFCSQNKSISSFSLQYPISLFSFLLQPMSTLHKIFYKDENENQDCMRKSLRSVEFSVTYFIKDLSVCVEVLIYSTSLFLVTTIMDESFPIVF